MPSFFISRTDSHVTMHPTPSSDAPMPTSHESKWPPTRTISSGSSLPRISPMTLADSASALESRLHPQPDAHAPAAIGDPLHALGVFGRDRRGRNLRDAVRVVHAAGVRRAQARRADGAHEHGHRPVTRRRAGAAGAVLVRLAVARVDRVEEHDLALRLGAALRELVEALDDHHVGFDARGRRGHAAAEAEQRDHVARRLDDLQASPRRAPTSAPSPFRCARSRGRPSSSPRRPTRSPASDSPTRRGGCRSVSVSSARRFQAN